MLKTITNVEDKQINATKLFQILKLQSETPSLMASLMLKELEH